MCFRQMDGFFSLCQMDILNGGILDGTLEGKIKKLIIRRKTYDRNEVKMRKLPTRDSKRRIND